MKVLTVPITIFVKPAMAKELRVTAARKDLTRSELVRVACEAYLAKLQKAENGVKRERI